MESPLPPDSKMVHFYRIRLRIELPKGLGKFDQNWRFWLSQWSNFEKTHLKRNSRPKISF